MPLARLTATGADTVTVGESRWATAYLAAAIAGTVDDVFAPESYAAPLPVGPRRAGTVAGRGGHEPDAGPPGSTPNGARAPPSPRDRRPVDVADADAAAPAATRTTPPTRRPSESNGASGSG